MDSPVPLWYNRCEPMRSTLLSAPLLLAAAFCVRGDIDTSMTGEDLLFMDVPVVVVTATRRPQPLSEAPVTVHVLTHDDVLLSGATTIADVLRLVPGVDVVTLTARNQSVGIRGLLLNAYSCKLLVMVDGRTIYWDIFGAILWEGLPVSLEEIERIEVVRSPASSLYGPSAVAGVVNIVTRTAKAIGGVETTLLAGEYGTLIGSALYGYSGSRFDVKASVGYDRTDGWQLTDEGPGTLTRINARVGYALPRTGQIALSAGRTRSEGTQFFPDEYIGSVSIDGTDDYVQADATVGGVSGRVYLHHKDAKLHSRRLNDEDHWKVTVLDADAQHTLKPLGWLSLLYGGNYRMNYLEKNQLIPDEHWQHIAGAFVDGAADIGRKLRVDAGVRVDYHPQTKVNVSPRGSVQWRGTPDHVVCVSGGTAYRNPTFLDSYLDLIVPVDSFPSLGLGVDFHAQGTDNLETEQLVFAEAAYRSHWFERLNANLDLFYHYHTNLYHVRLDPLEFDTATSRFAAPMRTYNNRNAHAFGGELSLDMKVASYLHLNAGYSYQRTYANLMENTEPQLAPEDFFEIRSAPRHKLNAGVKLRLKRLRIGIFLNWVDKTMWYIDDEQLSSHKVTLEPYTLLNATLGYEFENVGVWLSAFDLFDLKHYEYPPGYSSTDPNAHELRQRVSLKLTGKL